MFGLGPIETAVIAIVGFMLFGNQLPSIVGKGFGMINQIKDEIKTQTEAVKEPILKEIQAVKELTSLDTETSVPRSTDFK